MNRNIAEEEPGTRTAIAAVTPQNEPCTLVVCRHGMGRDAQVWVSHHGTWEGTAVLTRAQVGELIEAARKAA